MLTVMKNTANAWQTIHLVDHVRGAAIRERCLSLWHQNLCRPCTENLCIRSLPLERFHAGTDKYVYLDPGTVTKDMVCGVQKDCRGSAHRSWLEKEMGGDDAVQYPTMQWLLFSAPISIRHAERFCHLIVKCMDGPQYLCSRQLRYLHFSLCIVETKDGPSVLILLY